MDWTLTTIPWCKEGFWIESADENKELQLGNSGEHLMGLFYIQEASSMLPAVVLLDNKPASMVLDMAAAPGSKTTQLAALMENKGTILANELSASRVKVLHANIQRCGVLNSCLSHIDGTAMDKYLTGTFDAILLDAPCGGEGTCRKDPKALDNWSVTAMETISAVQKQLIQSAWKMLKPGGRLVYSTCTLSQAENQQVISSLVDEVGAEMSVIDLGQLFPDASKVLTKEGYLQIWPEVFDCEGFFVACLEKQQSAHVETSALLKGQSPFKQLDNKTFNLIQTYYLQHFGFDCTDLMPRLRIRHSQRQQQIWLFPDQGEQLRQQFHLQRSGIRVCDLIESRNGPLLKTQHEFIIGFGDIFVSQVVELTAAEATACYKGENILCDNSKALTKGEVVMRHHGIPLGLAKVITSAGKIKLKNNLPRDLLRNNAQFSSVAS